MSNAKELIAEAKVVYLDHTKDWGVPPHDCPCPACLAHDLAVLLKTTGSLHRAATKHVIKLRKRVQELEDAASHYEHLLLVAKRQKGKTDCITCDCTHYENAPAQGPHVCACGHSFRVHREEMG